MLKYQELIERLSVEEVNSTIRKMVDNYDLTGKYHNNEKENHFIVSGERLIKKYFNLSPEFLSLMDDYAQKECDIRFSLELPFFACNEPLKKKVEYKKEDIYSYLLKYLESKAKKILDNREYLRIPIGTSIDFKECMLSNKYLGKVEFYKDGGWGIAEENGTVLVKNRLTRQPSETSSLYSGFSFIKTPYRIIQDRDTNKYGIISFESFNETVHCLYDKIEIVDFYEDSTRHFFIKALKNNKWGCFDEKCALIIDFEYDVIQLVSGFLECIKEAEYHLDDSLSERDRTYVIEGKRDLYDSEGSLLIGGYDNLFVDYQYYKFYFGTSYEYYDEEETDIQGYPVPLSKVRINFEKSKCLVLDKEFKTIINNGNGFFRMPKWHRFHSLDEVERFVPSGYLLRYGVDLSDFGVFIYLYNYYGEQYIVPYYIKEGFATPEEYDNYKENKSRKKLQNLLGEKIKEPDIDKPFDYSEFSEYPLGNQQDLYVDDSIVTILMLNSKKEVAWIDYANEIMGKMYYPHIYRIGKKYGIFDHNGLRPAYFDAITRNSADMNIYVASFELCQDPNPPFLHSLNFCQQGWYLIRYYKINDDKTLTPMADDWNVFDPTKYKWFPYDFIDTHYDVGYSSSGYSCDSGHEWTDEDAWDAMTDGMYGEYPGSGWDPEAFGY